MRIEATAGIDAEETLGAGTAGFRADGNGVSLAIDDVDLVIDAAFFAGGGLNLLRVSAGVVVSGSGFIAISEVGWEPVVHVSRPPIGLGAVVAITSEGETTIEA